MKRRLPWFSWPAIRYLDKWLQPQHRVFEIGGGGSTLFFADRVAHVWTLEQDDAWATRIKAVGLGNITILTEDEEDPFPSFAPDLIVIDGPDDFTAPVNRTAALAWALPRVAAGGLIVLDDSWCYRHVLPAQAEIKVGVGPCRLGITETALISKFDDIGRN